MSNFHVTFPTYLSPPRWHTIQTILDSGACQWQYTIHWIIRLHQNICLHYSLFSRDGKEMCVLTNLVYIEEKVIVLVILNIIQFELIPVPSLVPPQSFSTLNFFKD